MFAAEIEEQVDSDERLDALFRALADPTRRAIVARLAQGEATVSELVEPFSISQPAISRHLDVLAKAGLVLKRVDRTRRPRSLNAAPLAEVAAWVNEYRKFWDDSFDKLDTLLAEMTEQTELTEPANAETTRRTHD